MFKFIVMFTKTMAGLTIIATGLKGINIMMLKAEMPKENIVVESKVEVVEEQENNVPEVNVKVEEKTTQNTVSNANINVVKEEKNTEKNNTSKEIKEQNKVNINNTTTNQANEDANKNNVIEQKNNENNQQKIEEKETQNIQAQIEQEETMQEVVQPKIEVKRNDEYIQKIKNYISTHETERMKKYGYTFVVDANVVKLTNPFTYSEYNMATCLDLTGEIIIYAQDYYYNGQFVETQCFVY